MHGGKVVPVCMCLDFTNRLLFSCGMCPMLVIFIKFLFYFGYGCNCFSYEDAQLQLLEPSYLLTARNLVIFIIVINFCLI